uniref:PH domain-containing protein n=1 Tax=Gopherus agassizii TaxID=38772 RepID=A0A452HEW2_9SAUR
LHPKLKKSGFLIGPLGHIVHNWKARWFVLLQDKLLYYKLDGGRKEPSPKGRIILDGCTITCPCLEYENRPVCLEHYHHSFLCNDFSILWFLPFIPLTF